MTTKNLKLEVCPFCGEPLFMRGGPNNYGRCETNGCWVNERKATVPVDDPRQVAQWNTRAVIAASTELETLSERIADLREISRADKGRRIEIALKMLTARFPIAASLSTAALTSIVNAMEDFAQLEAFAASLRSEGSPCDEAEPGRDERSAFENWAAGHWLNSHPPHAAWTGWEARAARDHKPPHGGDAIAAITAERCRQIEVEGWAPEHDDAHGGGEMAAAAAAYAFSAATAGRYYAADPLGFWPWDPSSWKPKSPREDLVRAGALIIAEIERIDRAAREDCAQKASAA